MAPADERFDIEIGRMLRAFEGPAGPMPRRRRRRVARPAAAALGAAALVVTIGISASLLVGGGPRRDAALATRACPTVELGGRTYRARATRVGAFRLGAATEPGLLRCDDGGRSVILTRIAGVDPRSAVARRDAPGTVYVAEGICRTGSGEALVACLRRISEAP